MIEKATARIGPNKRTVTLNGKLFPVAIADPVAMARAIKRRKSKPVDREARLRAAEVILGLR
jgi:hypothetical protein